MKLNEIKNFPETFSIIFDHFEKYNIESSWNTVESYKNIYDKIMNSEFDDISYLMNTHSYHIDFFAPDNFLKDKAFIIMCKDVSKKNFIDLLIDFSDSERISFIKIEFSFDKHPPFAKSLIKNDKFKISYIDEPDEYADIDDSAFISLPEFKEFVSKIIEPDSPVMIEVD